MPEPNLDMDATTLVAACRAVFPEQKDAGLRVAPAYFQCLVTMEIIRQALARAALSPAHVDVLDGHGTAMRLGDAIEVKCNIGHTEAEC